MSGRVVGEPIREDCQGCGGIGSFECCGDMTLCPNCAGSGEEPARAQLPNPQAAPKPELAVWYGPMPESNGKSNFTALLHRKGESLLRGTTITIDRSEYPDRVRYEADRVRYLLGELDVEPCILDYDTDLHSGYGKDRPAPAMKELVEALKDYMAGDIGVSCQRGIVIRCQCQGCRFTRAATAIAKFTEGA